MTSQTQLLRQGSLNYGSTWWSANVIAQAYQTLQPDPSVTVTKPYSLLPQVNLNARRPDFYLTDVAFAGQYTAFSSATLIRGDGWWPTRRLRCPSFSLVLRDAENRRARDQLFARTSHDDGAGHDFAQPADLQCRRRNDLRAPDRLVRRRGAADAGAAPLLPNVPYRDQSQIPVFDSWPADFNFAQIFSENQFVGYDRVSDANQLTAAVVSRLIDPASGAEAMRAMFGQRYYFQNQRVTLPGQTLSA